VRSGNAWERMLRRLLPALSGVHLVEAGKSLYGATPVPVGRARRQWSPVREASAALSKSSDQL